MNKTMNSVLSNLRAKTEEPVKAFPILKVSAQSGGTVSLLDNVV